MYAHLPYLLYIDKCICYICIHMCLSIYMDQMCIRPGATKEKEQHVDVGL